MGRQITSGERRQVGMLIMVARDERVKRPSDRWKKGRLAPAFASARFEEISATEILFSHSIRCASPRALPRFLHLRTDGCQ